MAKFKQLVLLVLVLGLSNALARIASDSLNSLMDECQEICSEFDQIDYGEYKEAIRKLELESGMCTKRTETHYSTVLWGKDTIQSKMTIKKFCQYKVPENFKRAKGWKLVHLKNLRCTCEE